VGRCSDDAVTEINWRNGSAIICAFTVLQPAEAALQSRLPRMGRSIVLNVSPIQHPGHGCARREHGVRGAGHPLYSSSSKMSGNDETCVHVSMPLSGAIISD
jgi:hypothetical protein